MLVLVTVGAAAHAREQHRGSDTHYEETRGQREPGIQRLRHDELRQEERHEAEREDAGGVGHRDDPTEEERVERSPPCADEIAGHDRLAMPRRECVRGTPEGRDQERDQHDAEGEIATGDERLEATTRVRGGLRSVERGRNTRAAPEGDPSGRCVDIGRRAEEVLRVRAQLVAPALGGRGRLDDLGSFGRVDDDLLPADAGREVAVPEREPGSRRRGVVDGVEAQRLQPARSRPLDGPTLEHAQRRAAAVDAEVEVPCRLGGERRPADRVAELERRDLGHVERVVDVDAAARELDRRVPVDREVAERMRLRRRRDEQRRQAGDDEQEPLHARASRATGAQRMEKCGFRSSARRNHVFAAPSWPRQRSIMARWK